MAVQQLQLKRLRFCREADTWLRVMKSRTEITPNLLCRLGFCMSLEEPGVPDPNKYAEDSDREINRYTLLGEFDAVFVSLLRQRLIKDGIRDELLDEQFSAHMNRGVLLLQGRLKDLSEIEGLVSGAARASLPRGEKRLHAKRTQGPERIAPEIPDR
jgi:DNA sulfur modification protein DndE